jgi:phosphonate transport system permease protein
MPETERQVSSDTHRVAPKLPWHARINALSLTLLLFGIAVAASWPALRGTERSINYFTSLRRFLANFFPPDLSVVPEAMRALAETCQIAVMATLFSVLLSIPLAAAGAQTIAPRWLVAIVRSLLNAIRTVPSLIWALLAVAVVGPYPLAGVIALTFYSIGYLAKFFSDAFESVDLKVARALRALGADPVQSVQYGLWPQARPLLWSHSLWMLEYNVRSASIIGYVGAGGIGLQLHTYQEYYQWEKFAAVLLLIFLVVTLLDLAGERIRRQLTSSRRAAPPLAVA